MISILCLVAAASPITLEEVRAASRQNLDALKAELELRRQQEGVTWAKSAIFPQVAINSTLGAKGATESKTLQPAPIPDPSSPTHDLTYYPVSPGYTSAGVSLSLSVTQLIYDGGRWWNQIAQNGGQERAALGQLDEQRLVSELEAVNRFYQLLSAQFTLGVLENAVKRSETQVDRAKSMFEAGRAAKLDAIDAEVNLGNDRINVLRQQNTVTAAQVELLKWLGQPTREVEAVDPGSRPAPVAALEDVMLAARGARPLLRALDAQIVVMERAVDVAWSAYLPSVSLAGTYTRAGNSVDPVLTDLRRNNNFSLGLNLGWNVFNGFGNQAQVDQARENLTQARLTRDRAEVDLDGDLRRSLRALEVQQQVEAIAAENLKLAESSVKLAEERFAQGAGSTLEVRDAQVKLVSAQLNRLQSRVDVALARAALKRVIGAELEESR
jgi:outer membrane protein TolC